MLSLLDWLRRLDARVLVAPKASESPAAAEARWGAVVAVLGGLLVLAAGLLLQGHSAVQLAVISVGLVLTVPYVQNSFDKALARPE